MGIAGVQTTSEHHGAPRMRCVALCVGHDALPPDLDAALRKRAVPTVIRRNVYDALAELCAERAPAALIIVEPNATPHAAELLDACAKYAPHATLWRYDGDADERLRAFTHAPGAHQPKPPETPDVVVRPAVAQSMRPHPPRPALRLAPTDDHSAPLPPDAHDPPPASVLSDDELSMLLGDEPNRDGGAR